MATFDAKKLSKLDWGVAGAGGIAFIALFLPWYGYSDSFDNFSVSVDGWSTSYGWFGALLIIAAGVYIVLQRSQVNLPKTPIGPAVVILGASALGTLIVALRWLTVPRASFGLAGSYGPRVGIIIALLAGIVQAVCAFLLFRTSGEVLPWVKSGSPAAGAFPQQTGGYPQQAGGFPPQAGGIPSPTGEFQQPSYIPQPTDSAPPPSDSIPQPQPSDSMPQPTDSPPLPSDVIPQPTDSAPPPSGAIPQPTDIPQPGDNAHLPPGGAP